MVKETLNTLLKQQSERTIIQLVRYFFVGGAAFLVDFGSLFVLTDFFGLYYLVSAAIAFILGLIVNYGLSISWVFNNRTLENSTLEFGVFSLIGIVGLGLNEIFIWFFTAEIGFYYLISKMISAVIVLFWNFFARKFVLFR
ncbi:GtrA family protein [Methanobacterium sp. CWC-01]|uniref:GtrA family protein n=1 Tax=Methanobacterium aridiramus TaxID=2584467 RepID=UPI002577E5C4|nr:GtrA family protein [Methanobacterium sp. CWC-01]WJI08593.1 GtrA family protein [Methanobacterium sp. CWC-01]